MEQKIKEKLLLDLIDKMSDMGADRMKPKSLGVEVQAKDPVALKEGLDKARDLVGKEPELDSVSHDHEAQPSEDDDEHRLLDLLGDDDDELGR
jgi:hypothetical protein